MEILKKISKSILVVFLLLVSAIIGFFVLINIPVDKINENSQLGVTFSYRYAQDIGLDWKENLIAILDDLEVKKIRIPVYWDWIEPREGEYDFADLDWQLDKARQKNAEVILVVGQKVPRWPECFIPEWTKNDAAKKKEALLAEIYTVVNRYKNNPAVKYWQVENEPFLNFGICPPADADLVSRETSLVRQLDPSRKVIVTDSGELSLWYKAASFADVFGTTMYRTIWSNRKIFGQPIGYWEYPIGPRFFWVKGWLVDLLDGQKDKIVIELQSEPWINGWTTSAALSEQFKSMNVEQLKSNVVFAKKVGFPEIYLWGAEWWYWLKVRQDHPELWNAAKELFAQNKN